MDQISSQADINELRKSIDTKHRETFARQAKLIQHVQDVKAALKQVFEKVIAEQHATSKLFTEARDSIQSYNDNEHDEGTYESLREQLQLISAEQGNIGERLDRYHRHLTQAETVLKLLSDTLDSNDDPLDSSDALEARLLQKTNELENALEEIEILNTQLDEIRDESSSSLEAVQRKRSESLEQIKASDEKIARLEYDLEIEQAKSSVLQARLDEAQSEIADIRATVEQRSVIEEEAADLRHKLESLQASLRYAEQRATTAEEAERKLSERLSIVNLELGELRSRDRSNTADAPAPSRDTLVTQAELENLRPLRSKVRELEEMNKSLEIKLEYLAKEKDRAVEEAHVVTARSKLARELEVANAERKAATKRADELQRAVDALEAEVQNLRSLKGSGTAEDIKFDEVAARQQLGDLLVASGVITQEQLDNVIDEHGIQNARGRIGSLIVKKGYASEDAIAQALAHQMSVPFLRLKFNTIQPDAVHRISGKLAETHNCIPVSLEGDELKLAMANPMDLIAIENVEHASGFRVIPCLATLTDINNALRLHYANVAAKR